MSPNSFSKFLNNISLTPLHVIDSSIPHSEYIPIDLSKNNSELNTFDNSSSQCWQDYINNFLIKHKKSVAIGGYCEQRNIYHRSPHFNNNSAEERNIHLGIDLWIPVNTKIYTPLDATIHSFKNNTNLGDYGPTIILKHTILNKEFYTLYGHLSIDSLQKIKVGQKFKAGDCIATLGSSKVNGDYASHVHFQIIKNIGPNFGDYPGVCSKKNLDEFVKNCPDPNILLKYNFN